MSGTDDAGNEGTGPGRRRRAPVIELEATEIGAEDKRTGTEKARSRTGAVRRGWQERLAGNPLTAPLTIAAIVGVLAGAVTALSLILLLDRGDARTEAAVVERRTGTSGLDPLAERMDRLNAAIGSVEKRLAAMEARPAGPAAGTEPPAAELESTLARLRDALTDLDARDGRAQSAAAPALEALTRRIAALEERIAALAPPSRPPEKSTAMAELAALMALSDAIDAGRPFAHELKTAREAMGERAVPLAPLEQDAAAGLPTVAVLAERFTILAPAIIRGPQPDGDFLSRLLTSAARLVEVRPLGETEGRDTGAVVARIEARLGRGDLAAALAEVPQLPMTARAAAADWIAVAARRRDAERTVKSLIDGALAAPERPTP